VLGLGFGLAVGVGGVIGGGILRAPGSALDHVPLPWLVLVLWALAGAQALLGANVVAEVMTSVPKSGGLFNVAERAFGSFGALLVGWSDWLINAASVAALAIAAAEFLAIIIPSLKPYVPLMGAAVALTLSAVNWLGVREGKFAQIVTSCAKAVLLVGIVMLIVLFKPAPATAPASVASVGAVTFVGIVVAYQLIVAAYGGWSAPSYFAEEDTDPGKNIPRALFGSILTVAAIYLMMNAALLYALPIGTMRTAELPASLAVANIFGHLSLVIVAAIAVVTVLSCTNASVMIATRILHGLARDGFVPRLVSRVNRGGTPDLALAITGAFAVLLALTGRFETIFLITGALVVFVNALIDAALFKLRWSEPDLPRPYQSRGYPWLPGLALILDLALVLAFLSADVKSAIYMVAAVGLCVPMTLIANSRRQDMTRNS
jgi:APA family basic amino acid/polyamine antiporter